MNTFLKLLLLIIVLCNSTFAFTQKKTLKQVRAQPVAALPTTIVTGTVSVMDFGAIGNGLTDDTYAVQKAINSGAGTIYFPTTIHGYRLGKLSIPSAITLSGDNKQSTIITPLQNGITVFTINSTFVTIKNFYFVSYKNTTVNDTIIQFRGSINTIENCFFSGVDVGIYNNSLFEADEQYIKNCRFRDCNYGILSDGYFRNTRISDYCIFHTCKCAISLYDNNDYIHTTEGVVIENSMIYDCGDKDLGKGAINIENCDFTFIRNSMVDLNHYLALNVIESKWCDFSGTYFSSNHSGNVSAARIFGDCSDLFILNCRFFDSRGWGLELQGNKRIPSNITISDCSFRLNPQGDVLVNGVDNVRISRSNFYTDVPTSIAAISNDGPTNVYVSECSIKGGMYKGVEKVEMTVKDCLQKQNQK